MVGMNTLSLSLKASPENKNNFTAPSLILDFPLILQGTSSKKQEMP
jgi:hypothetical protein